MSTAEKFFAKLDELHQAGKFYGFSIWPTNDGYQVNLATGAKNNWRVRRGATPEEGIEMVLGMDFMDDDLPRTPAQLLGEEILAPPLVDEPPRPIDFELEDIPVDEEHDEAGIFD